MPEKLTKGAAPPGAVPETSLEPDGGAARSALEDSALLARFQVSLAKLLEIDVRWAGEEWAKGEPAGARRILEELREGLSALVTSFSYATQQASKRMALEWLIAAEPGPSDNPAAEYERYEEIIEERLAKSLTRFTGSLARDIYRRFVLAKLLGERPEKAAESLTKKTILGEPLLKRYQARLARLIADEWALAQNDGRLQAILEAARLGRVILAAYHCKPNACERCKELAQGGPWQRGLYMPHEAPVPIRDTHPHCRCKVFPWPDSGFAESNFDKWLEANPGALFLYSVGEGAIESLNPIEMIKGLRQVSSLLWHSENRRETLKELGLGAITETGRTLKQTVTFGDPREHGRAIGSFLPDVVLTLLGPGVAKWATKGLESAKKGAAATKAMRGARRAQKASQSARKAKATRQGRLWDEWEEVGSTKPRAKTQPKAKGKSGNGRKKHSKEEKLEYQARGRAGEARMAQWAEQNGREILYDPRSRSVNTKGPDMISLVKRNGETVIEIWDNKALSSKNTISGSKCLENIAQETLQKGDLGQALAECRLPKEAIREITRRIGPGAKNCKIERVISNAGGTAAGGPALAQKGLRFVEIN